MDIQLRFGQVEDTAQIAALVQDAGAGIFEFLLNGLVAGVDASDLLKMAVSDADSPLSHTNAVLADAGESIVGLMLGYPSRLYGLPPLLETMIPRRRLDHVRELLTNRVDDSFYINSLVVTAAARRQGLGRMLVACAAELARQQGFEWLSLHVWLDNFPALKLYRNCGFEIVRTIPVGRAEQLQRDADMALMQAPVAATLAKAR